MTRFFDLVIIYAVTESHLPYFPTPLVGRSAYLHEIAHLLDDPECRLLTLVGPGGIGKTRLAVEAARRFTSCDAVYFVQLQPVAEPAGVAGAIADAAGLRTGMTDNPQQELLEQVREQAWLLVLDNFEHLLEAAPLLSELLAQAPRLRLLVTSRVRLDLLEEFVLKVSGLSCPFSEHDMNPERSGAVELFVQRARRADAGFVLTPAHHHAVFRIVHLVEGMPLGIELAANWVRALPCDEIADEIERSLDILQSSGRNMEPRHRSIRAAFEWTWQQLAPEQRSVFMPLSVFRGGFTREAAAAVAGVSLPVLSALIDHSLLRADESGRYYVHELLRQYAQEWLEQDTNASNQARDAHSVYYAGFLEARNDAILGAAQGRVLQEVAAELDNIRAAWQWAVQQLHVELLHRAAYTLYHFADFRGRYREGAGFFEQAIAALELAGRSTRNDRTMALLLVLNGWNYIRLGDYTEAAQVFERSLSLFYELETGPPPGFGTDPLMGLAFTATVCGDYVQALILAEAASAAAEERSDTNNLQIGRYVQASASYGQGAYPAAREYAEQAGAMATEAGNQWMVAYVLIVLGDVARAQGNLLAAQNQYQRCFELHSILGNPEGMAAACAHLAHLAWLAGDYPTAASFYQQSYELYHKVNDPGGQVRALAGLGDTAQAMGDKPGACVYFQQALALATSIRSIPLLLLQLTPIGELLAQAEEPAAGAQLWQIVIGHWAGEHAMQKRAQQNLVRLQGKTPYGAPEPTPGQPAVGQPVTVNAGDDLFVVAAQLQEKLASLPLAPEQATAAPVAQPKATTAQGALIEPLSERELEILRLLAQGYTNQQIADALTVVVGTVKAHNHHIFGKLSAANRVQALARAQELGLI